MKPFHSYFYEASKLFEFRVKIAGVDPKGDTMDKIKNSLDAYQVETIGKVKRLPIQEHRDFDSLGPCECYMFDVALRYPTVADQVKQLIIERGQLPAKAVVVYTKQQAEQQEICEQPKEEKSPILEQPELTSESGQELVGEKRVSSFLKELETRKQEIAGKEKTDGKTTNDLQQGKESPVGSTKNKKPEPKSFAR